MDLQIKNFSDIDVTDHFFDSLRESYPEFNKWYEKKVASDETAYCYYIDGELKDFLYLKIEIVTYLSVLNDFLIMEFKASGGRDFVSFLTKFAGDHQLEGASFEGTKLDKFNFIFPDGTEAYCEPHLKMFTDDSGNKNQHCRIHFKKPLENESIVYVGCICKHL